MSSKLTPEYPVQDDELPWTRDLFSDRFPHLVRLPGGVLLEVAGQGSDPGVRRYVRKTPQRDGSVLAELVCHDHGTEFVEKRWTEEPTRDNVDMRTRHLRNVATINGRAARRPSRQAVPTRVRFEVVRRIRPRTHARARRRARTASRGSPSASSSDGSSDPPSVHSRALAVLP